jgi:hypothetical protein
MGFSSRFMLSAPIYAIRTVQLWHFARFRTRCCRNRSDRFPPLKIIIRIREGQTNKQDSAIAEGDWSFVCSMVLADEDHGLVPGVHR